MPHGTPDATQCLPGQGTVADAHGPLERREVAVEMAQQRGFARPVGSDNPHRLPMDNPERDPPQRLGAAGIGIVQILDFNDVVTQRPILMTTCPMS